MDLEVFDSNFCLFVLFSGDCIIVILYLKAPKTYLGHTQIYIQYMPVAIFPPVRWPELTGYHFYIVQWLKCVEPYLQFSLNFYNVLH